MPILMLHQNIKSVHIDVDIVFVLFLQKIYLMIFANKWSANVFTGKKHTAQYLNYYKNKQKYNPTVALMVPIGSGYRFPESSTAYLYHGLHKQTMLPRIFFNIWIKLDSLRYSLCIRVLFKVDMGPPRINTGQWETHHWLTYVPAKAFWNRTT